jgi:hypothetical protein
LGGNDGYLDMIRSTLSMIESVHNSPDSLLSSEKSLSSTPINSISSFNNLTSVLFNLNQEGKPFANIPSDNTSDEMAQDVNNKFNEIVMIIKLSKIVSEEDNFGTGDYFLNNTVFFISVKGIFIRYIFFTLIYFRILKRKGRISLIRTRT